VTVLRGEALRVALAAKLQMRSGQSFALVNAPAGFDGGDLAAHPDAPEAHADLVLVFASDSEDLAGRTSTLASAVARGALSWIAYPKAGQLGTDLNRDRVRVHVVEHGLDTVRQVALDDVWSALRLKSV
jgi:hypothetical protein